MAKRDRLEEALKKLSETRRDPTSKEHQQRLRSALTRKNGVVVGLAAEIVREYELYELLDLLPPAFDTLMSSPVKRDPQCQGKLALATAMYQMDCSTLEPYWRGLFHVQMEPVWGGHQDTAGELRARCAIALMDAGDADAWEPVTEMLLDLEANARMGAARAIGRSGRSDIGVPVLRLKIRFGDPSTPVLTACLCGLLELSGEQALDYVVQFLSKNDQHQREAALLALGESRLDAALKPLVAFCETAMSSDRHVGFMAISMLRTEAAWSALIDIIKHGTFAAARDALRALAIYHHDHRVRERVEAALHARDEKALDDTFAHEFARS